jgi:hypothetical protein
MTDINEDGFTKDEIETALSLLSILKERADNNGEEYEYADVSQTAYYLRNYKESSEWHEERPSDRVDPSKNTTLSECVERIEDD